MVCEEMELVCEEEGPVTPGVQIEEVGEDVDTLIGEDTEMIEPEVDQVKPEDQINEETPADPAGRALVFEAIAKYGLGGSSSSGEPKGPTDLEPEVSEGAIDLEPEVPVQDAEPDDLATLVDEVTGMIEPEAQPDDAEAPSGSSP